MANVTGKMKVFRKELCWTNNEGKVETRVVYSTTISSKDKDGKYVNGYMDVKFPNKEPKDKDITKTDYEFIDIDISDGFLSTRKTKDNLRFEIVVLKWKKAEE